MAKDNCEIVIGTSGYSFDDWSGVFYPPDLPKGKRLDFYKGRFNAVEIGRERAFFLAQKFVD